VSALKLEAAMSPVTDSAFRQAKQTVTVTIEFCNWLAAGLVSMPKAAPLSQPYEWPSTRVWRRIVTLTLTPVPNSPE
jgi:hypothetical protein